MSAFLLLADVEPSVSAVEIFPVVILLGVGCAAWFVLLRTLRSGREPVPFEPQQSVPWNGVQTLAAILFQLVLTIVGGAILINVLYSYAGVGDRPPLDAIAEPDNDPRVMIAMFQSHCFLTSTAALAILLFLHFSSRATAADFGLSCRRFGRDLCLGLIGFCVIVPPVMILQGLLNALWMKTQHPIVLLWKEHGDPELFFWSAVAAVVVAPLTEEFLFRGVIQGWLQRAFADRTLAEPEAPSADAEPRLPDGLEFPSLTSPARKQTAPVVLSALLFALVHLPNGPDVIPIFFLGLGLGYLYRQTHSIWPGVIVHFLMNGWSMVLMGLYRDQL